MIYKQLDEFMKDKFSSLLRVLRKTIIHSIVYLTCSRLEVYSFCDMPLTKTKRCLCNCKQENNASNKLMKKCNTGVPLGSILEPFTFHIFLNGIFVTNFCSNSYADIHFFAVVTV